MAKKCIICNKDAQYQVKDTADYYCEECAEEYFGDIALLVKVEDEAKRLKEFIEEKLENASDAEDDAEQEN